MRVICLDVGEKRIGVAVTDPLDLTAQAVETIWTKGFERDSQRVLELCRQYETDRILCGLPLNMDGSAGFQAQRIRDFADVLVAKGLNVRFQDERLTTKQAGACCWRRTCAATSARHTSTSWPQPTSYNPFWTRAAGARKNRRKSI